MLGLRPSTNINVRNNAVENKLNPLLKGQHVKLNQKPRTTLKKRGPKVTDENVTNTVNKPKPLQASTNTIHSHQPAHLNLKQQLNHNPSEEKLKKKTHTKNPGKTISKVDENDVNSFVGGSYDPLLDFHGLDEELYQKVLKLEIADDGLPSLNVSEPFDF